MRLGAVAVLTIGLGAGTGCKDNSLGILSPCGNFGPALQGIQLEATDANGRRQLAASLTKPSTIVLDVVGLRPGSDYLALHGFVEGPCGGRMTTDPLVEWVETRLA